LFALFVTKASKKKLIYNSFFFFGYLLSSTVLMNCHRLISMNLEKRASSVSDMKRIANPNSQLFHFQIPTFVTAFFISKTQQRLVEVPRNLQDSAKIVMTLFFFFFFSFQKKN
jgi:hypothetical protein